MPIKFIIYLEKKKVLFFFLIFQIFFSGFVAALLLQGSVQVYSRKVEYLYSLVLRALEFLSRKRFVCSFSYKYCFLFNMV